ncbi:FIMAH domain-containing protein [Oceanobacillus sp. 1P07AA]|uniref:FIMAH domain-containing protein n=1 Tax=Oceanobacillus sp. 1P07AA TaxID=3132293 RepID=UPI0039A669D0
MKNDIWKRVMFFVIVLVVISIPVSGVSAETERDWMTNEEFLERLSEIVEASDGKVETDVSGYSEQGKEVISARIGTGDQVILITGSIHGNEKSGGEALVEILEYLGTSDSSFAQSIRDEVTIVAIPRYNVDGLEIPQRQNIFSWEEVISTYPHLEGATPAWYYNERNGGFDLNRDFNADLNYEVVAEDLPGHTNDFGFFITKESQLLRDHYVDLQEEFGQVEAYVDLHHMGTPVMNQTGEDVTIAIDYPPLGPEDSTKYNEYPLLDQDKSKRYALAAALGVKEFSDKEEPGVAQYIHFQERDFPGQARSAFALNGTATVLFEMPGQQPQFGYDQDLVDRVENGLWGIISHMADGSIDNLNGDDFLTEIPRYWTDNITDMRDVMVRFTEEGQFKNERDARLVDTHLAALENYENQDNSEKMVKHLNGFKVLLDSQRENGLIEQEAYNRLNSDANLLLERWGNKPHTNTNTLLEGWENNLID